MESKLTEAVKTFNELTPGEIYDILHLRQEVFVIEQKCIFQDLDYKDQKAHHFMIRNEEGQLLAYTRLLEFNDPYPGYLSIGRVVNHPDYRRMHLGRYLMLRSIEEIRKLHGNHPIKIGAQAYLTRFYSQFGFSPTGERYMEDGIPHLKMVTE